MICDEVRNLQKSRYSRDSGGRKLSAQQHEEPSELSGGFEDLDSDFRLKISVRWEHPRHLSPTLGWFYLSTKLCSPPATARDNPPALQGMRQCWRDTHGSGHHPQQSSPTKLKYWPNKQRSGLVSEWLVQPEISGHCWEREEVVFHFKHLHPFWSFYSLKPNINNDGRSYFPWSKANFNAFFYITIVLLRNK